MRKKFEHFEVTADVGIIAYGRNLNELFQNAATAMFEVMCSTKKVRCAERKEIIAKSEDLEGLLVEWLTNLLALKDIFGMMFGKFKVSIDEKKIELKGSACGEATKKEHKIKTEVKAVTHHLLEVKKNKIWKAKFVLDV